MKMKIKFTKQLLSILLCAAMVATSLPLWAFTAETNQKAEGKTAVPGGIYLKSAITVQEDIFNATRTDFRDESVYTLMITRFNDGDSSNNVHCWDDAQAGNPDTDPAWRGDFKGLIEKLDYIKALGFTAIRLNPVAQNASGYDYHGYHPINLKEIDFRYESDGYTYQDVIDACHAKGLKVMQDVVLNSTSNFGEENLRNIFDVNEDADWSDITEALVPTELLLEKYPDYTDLPVFQQFQARMDLIKGSLNTDEFYHNETSMNYYNYLLQHGSIAGDCLDLNTENAAVALYLAESCFSYAEMGVDAIMISDARHINRWSLNEGILPLLRGMLDDADIELEIFCEVVSRTRETWDNNNPSASVPFYTWKETESQWQNNWDSTNAGANVQTSIEHYNAHSTLGDVPTSSNAVLDGITYHAPDYSKSSGMHPYDFTMMWNFENAGNAFRAGLAEDQYMNDSTWNLTSVDTWAYGPDGMEKNRYSLGTQAWAENLNLMFTFRGIPSILYGTEIEFQKNVPIDMGPNVPLSETGRAYYGDNLTGTITSDGFLNFTADGKIGETLNGFLAVHIRQLNAIRMSVPALRKGQYTISSDYVAGNMAFIKRYTNGSEGIDSLALVTISGGATFKNIPNGKYIDVVTGDVQNVTNGTLTVGSVSSGSMRVYVCCASGFTGLDAAGMSAASRTLRFSANGGSGTISSISIKGNEKAILPECTFTAPANSLFAGWNVNGTMYQPGDEVEFSVNSVARAVWKENHTHTVIYIADGQTVFTEDVECGKDSTLPSVPHKEGYIGKWDSDGKNIIDDTYINAVYTKIPAIKPNEVKLDDKTELEDNKAKLEEELKDDSYTEDDKKNIQDAIDDIDDALEIIGNVEAVEELIDKIPDTIEKSDESAIKAADEAYNALSDYEKSLVDEAAKKDLDDAKAALAELNKPVTDPDNPITDPDKPVTDPDNTVDEPENPQTADNSNMFLLIALLFISGGAVVTLAIVDIKRRYTVKH
ncbi:MAG: sortase B protein-sorting domain-containing protein [Ruminococcaceae bacterium]|nr:sortase B protein-sorting domain-containing protein [Oscillospiraceae bacterium]